MFGESKLFGKYLGIAPRQEIYPKQKTWAQGWEQNKTTQSVVVCCLFHKDNSFCAKRSSSPASPFTADQAQFLFSLKQISLTFEENGAAAYDRLLVSGAAVR